ncbi:MAG: hypothetical protein ACI841_003615, partial [Planctomycetota bacterium]
VVVESGQVLNLVDGSVLEERQDGDREPADEQAWAELSWENDVLTSQATLRVLPTVMGRTPIVERGLGEPLSGIELQEGLEISFERSESLWGYARVLAFDDDRLALEFRRGAPGESMLRRSPESIDVQREVSGRVHLAWPGKGPGPYRIWRRSLRAAGWDAEVIGEVADVQFLDEEAPQGVALEYRVAAIGGERVPFGAVANCLPRGTSMEWPIPIERDQRLDVLTGHQVDGPAHVLITYASDATVNMTPVDGTLLALLPSKVAVWEAPQFRRMRPGGKASAGEYSTNARSMRKGTDLMARLPEGLFVRLSLYVDANGPHLLRQTNVSGGRLLPRPPTAPRMALADGILEFQFDDLRRMAVHPEQLELVVESELAYGRGDWQELFVGTAGERSLLIKTSALAESALTRFRFRQRYGPKLLSHPTVPVLQLLVDPSDPSRVEDLIRQAVVDLSDANFDRRQAARALLLSLGDAARPALVESLESSDPELRSAARELILEDGYDGDDLEVVMRAYARAEGVASDPPQGWLEGDREDRALMLLKTRRKGARSEEEEQCQRGWLRVLATFDPDHSLRTVCSMLATRIDSSLELQPDGLPRMLYAPDRRSEPVIDAHMPDDWTGEMRENWTSSELANALRAGLDLDHLRMALIELEVAHHLDGRHARNDAPPATAMDALRLCSHYRIDNRAVLLDAARALILDPGARLAAWRELAGIRLAGSALVNSQDSAALGRKRRTLNEPNARELVNLLEELLGTSQHYVDIVLPPGIYQFEDSGRAASWLEIQVPGIRLLGNGDVVFEFGVRINGAEDIVLDGIEIANAGGAALIAIDSSLLLLDTRLAGSDYSMMLHRARVEAEGLELAGSVTGRKSSSSLRMQGACTMIARDSIFRGGALMPTEDSLLYLEACVIEGGERAAVQAQRGGEMVLRDVFLTSKGMGVHGLSGGLMEGVVVDVLRSPLGTTFDTIDLCPDHVHLGSSPMGENFSWLPRCPLVRRR